MDTDGTVSIESAWAFAMSISSLERKNPGLWRSFDSVEQFASESSTALRMTNGYFHRHITHTLRFRAYTSDRTANEIMSSSSAVTLAAVKLKACTLS